MTKYADPDQTAPHKKSGDDHKFVRHAVLISNLQHIWYSSDNVMTCQMSQGTLEPR